MRPLLISIAALSLPAAAEAGTKPVDLGALPSQPVHEVAKLTPLALTPGGSPAVVLLDVDAGEVVPPHATQSGTRLVTVISGDLSWGDGDAVDESRETRYPAGSVLVLPAGQMHWVAARGGPVRLQLIVLDDEPPVPAIAAQVQ